MASHKQLCHIRPLVWRLQLVRCVAQLLSSYVSLETAVIMLIQLLRKNLYSIQQYEIHRHLAVSSIPLL